MKKIVLCFLFIFSTLFVKNVIAEPDKNYPAIKVFGFTHLQALYDDTAGSNHGEEFRIARARIGAIGNITDIVDYMVLTEWGRFTYNDPVTLLDAWVNWKLNPGLNIKIGQTWYKFSFSGTDNLPKIPFIYRPEVVDGIWLTMGRNGSYAYDQGIELWGDFKESRFPWAYMFFITNGSGLDNFEDNGKKDFTGRAWIEPKKDLRLGLSGFYGHSRTEVTSNLGNEEKRDLPEYAYGLELVYTKERFRFIYEYLEGLYEGYVDINGAEVFHIATKRPRGWYTTFSFKPLSWIEIPVRYAWYEKDAVNSDTGLETVTAGVTWFLKEGTLNNVKLNYIIKSEEENYGSSPKNMVALQMQLIF
ncbi:MAG: OprO/OprP family phosphate-selective porin [Candidatus Omnitrophica bacterium]|nr:OprO/OprP family phosphate-selective porin [Candidatus Omnitrophota bacterium]MBU4149700.1 OprO/OprP family phosphate-selective porin [Candidatus Omnitrophota bacterium]